MFDHKETILVLVVCVFCLLWGYPTLLYWKNNQIKTLMTKIYVRETMFELVHYTMNKENPDFDKILERFEEYEKEVKWEDVEKYFEKKKNPINKTK